MLKFYVFVVVCTGAVRVGLVDREVIVNPTRKQLQHSTLDLVITAAANRKVG